jgi:hypothetical protein
LPLPMPASASSARPHILPLSHPCPLPPAAPQPGPLISGVADLEGGKVELACAQLETLAALLGQLPERSAWQLQLALGSAERLIGAAPLGRGRSCAVMRRVCALLWQGCCCAEGAPLHCAARCAPQPLPPISPAAATYLHLWENQMQLVNSALVQLFFVVAAPAVVVPGAEQSASSTAAGAGLQQLLRFALAQSLEMVPADILSGGWQWAALGGQPHCGLAGGAVAICQTLHEPTAVIGPPPGPFRVDLGAGRQPAALHSRACSSATQPDGGLLARRAPPAPQAPSTTTPPRQRGCQSPPGRASGPCGARCWWGRPCPLAWRVSAAAAACMHLLAVHWVRPLVAAAPAASSAQSPRNLPPKQPSWPLQRAHTPSWFGARAAPLPALTQGAPRPAPRARPPQASCTPSTAPRWSRPCALLPTTDWSARCWSS